MNNEKRAWDDLSEVQRECPSGLTVEERSGLTNWCAFYDVTREKYGSEKSADIDIAMSKCKQHSNCFVDEFTYN